MDDLPARTGDVVVVIGDTRGHPRTPADTTRRLGLVWLTSFEHCRWDIPRHVVLRQVLRQGPTARTPAASGGVPGTSFPAQPVVEYAVLTVAGTEPDGPMVLLGRRRDGRPWAPPARGERVDLSIWQLPEGVPAPVDSTALPRPMGNPTAWCTLMATRAEGQAAFERQASQGHSFPSYEERVIELCGLG